MLVQVFGKSVIFDIKALKFLFLVLNLHKISSCIFWTMMMMMMLCNVGSVFGTSKIMTDGLTFQSLQSLHKMMMTMMTTTIIMTTMMMITMTMVITITNMMIV